MRTQTVEWKGFFEKSSQQELSTLVIDMNDIKKGFIKIATNKQVLIKVTVLSIALIMGMPDMTYASTGIDIAADKIYKKLLNVGKWVIVVKGAIDTIQNAISGDLQAAKKNFLAYLMVYVILWALPWGLKQVDTMFADMEA